MAEWIQYYTWDSIGLLTVCTWQQLVKSLLITSQFGEYFGCLEQGVDVADVISDVTAIPAMEQW